MCNILHFLLLCIYWSKQNLPFTTVNNKRKKNSLPRLLIVRKLPFNFSVTIETLIITLSFLIVHRSSEHWFWGQTIYPATRSNSSSLIFAMLVNFQFKFNHGLDGGVWWVDGSTDQAMSIHTHIHSSRTWAPLTIYIKSRGKGVVTVKS